MRAEYFCVIDSHFVIRVLDKRKSQSDCYTRRRWWGMHPLILSLDSPLVECALVLVAVCTVQMFLAYLSAFALYCVVQKTEHW